jgi:AraC-like DNA-binding protein
MGRIEHVEGGSEFVLDGLKRPGSVESPIVWLQFTLAGWGNFEVYDQAPERIAAGMAFAAVVPSPHRYYLPPDSPGWTFGWLIVAHTYLVERFSKQVAAAGPILHIPPDSPFLRTAVRLICSSYRKDLPDRFEVERALFELLVDFDALVYQQNNPGGQRERLLDQVRDWVTKNPKRALNVDELAAEYGMSRTNFSHFFRQRTSLTPARFITQVRIDQAVQMLIETDAHVKQISDACGFANPNHFSRVFQRVHRLTPRAYRASRTPGGGNGWHFE